MSSRRSRSGGNLERNRRKPVVKVSPKSTFLNRPEQIAVRRRDDSDVGAFRLGSVVPEWPIGAELREVQEQLLRMHGKVQDLVEQQAPAAGILDEADALARSTRVRAALVAEKLRGYGVQVVA